MEPKLVRSIAIKLRKLWSEQRPRNVVIDKNSKPSLHDYVWGPWADSSPNVTNQSLPVTKFPLEVSIEEMEFVVSEHMDSFTDRLFNYVKSVRGSVMNSIRRFFY